MAAEKKLGDKIKAPRKQNQRDPLGIEPGQGKSFVSLERERSPTWDNLLFSRLTRHIVILGPMAG